MVIGLSIPASSQYSVNLSAVMWSHQTRVETGADAHPVHPPPGIPAMKVHFVLAACAVLLVAAPNAIATMLQLSSVGARSSAGERRAPSSDIARIERNAAYYE